MQGDKQTIDALNRVLKKELTAINQYFLHARMYDNWGLEGLGKYEMKVSIDAMKLADSLIGRVLFLEGLPNLQSLGKLLVGEDVPEMISNDLQLELGARERLCETITHCESVGDFVSREMLEEILESVEARIDWAETQLELIDKVGHKNYLQSAI